MENFIARQPIFNHKREVVAYELLFRNGLKNVFEYPDGTEATSHVIVNSLMLFGIRALTCGTKALINVTAEVLENDYMMMLPNDLVIPEVLEDIVESEEIVAACLRLKKAGYQIALDDIVSLEGREQCLQFADILKIDFMDTDEAFQKDVAKRFESTDVIMLAEKVETYEEFERGLDMGYSLFQGYFFAKPEVLSKKSVPGAKLQYMQLMGQIQQPKINLQQIENLIKQDMSLSFRLLMYINSAFFGLRVEIRSIKQALVLLGENEVRKWAALVAMTFMGSDKPAELILTSLSRARFCEIVATHVGLKKQSQDLFLMGMFSLLDAIVDRSREELLAELPISEQITSALLGEDSIFKDVLHMATSYECGNWKEFSGTAKKIGAPEEQIPDIYFTAVEWANQSLVASISQMPKDPVLSS